MMPPDSDHNKKIQKAIELEKSGQHEAAAEYRQILEQSPNHAWASHLLGAQALRQNHLDEAIRLFATAVSNKDDEPLFHFFLGHARMALQDWQAAAEAYLAVTQLAPNHAAAQSKLGAALKNAGRDEEAIKTFRKSMQLDSSDFTAGLQLARLLRDRGELKEATGVLQKLLLHHPDEVEVRIQTGSALLAGENYEEARKVYSRLFEMQRGTGWHGAPFDAQIVSAGENQGDIPISRFFLHNQIGHVRYLVQKKRIHKTFLALADMYQDILDSHQDLEDEYDFFHISGEQADRVRPFLFRAIHTSDSSLVEGDAVNTRLDCKALEQEYLASSGPMVVLDDFLSESALHSLRNFLLESSIFFRVSHSSYVASYVEEGFNCSVLYQIASELKQRFPRVLGNKELRNMWAYRQSSCGAGVRAHSDMAAVTFNFWITPDASNLDKDHGGLILYDRQQPLDWDWHTTNIDKDKTEVQERIDQFLEGANTINIPYRENRAVMFHSNLFHRSDSFSFREGYEHSRMNVTLLFGDHPSSVK